MYPGPGYGQVPPPLPGPPEERPSKHPVRNFIVIPVAVFAGLIVVIGVLAAALGGSSKPPVKPAAAPVTFTASPEQAQFTDPAGVACPASQEDNAGYCPGDDPSPSASAQDLSGPVGATFTVTETNSDTNAQDSYTVTAVKVLDPARGSDEFSTPDPGKRLIGVEFRITGTGGYAHDDANVDASLQGSDSQVYQPDYTSLAAGTNFSSGDFSVTDGRTQTGWVTFQVPQGVAISSVQWQSDPFGDSQPAVWTVH